MSDAAYYRVRQPFVVSGRNGTPRVVPVGLIVSVDDPLVKSHRALLDPVDELMTEKPVVEQATAAPGERRSVHPGRRGRAKHEPEHKKPAESEQPPPDPAQVESEKGGSDD